MSSFVKVSNWLLYLDCYNLCLSAITFKKKWIVFTPLQIHPALFSIKTVTGVALANASLDIALHDKILIASSIGLISEPEHIKPFWVGLMDGDGSIQVNHWREQSLQYRLIIKLSNLKSNYNMLIEIAKVLGGTVKITGKGAEVIWVVNKKQEVEKIIKIYEIYPPLTSKKICQLAFLKTCLTETSVETYLSNRNLKYDKQLTIINSNINFKIPTYFKNWLSGFIEAEGCFSIRKSNNHSFSIGQNDDKYILDKIKNHFNITNQVKKKGDRFWVIEIYRKSILINIVNHCIEYPLLGEKILSFTKFRDLFK